MHYFTGDYTPIVGGNSNFIATQGSSDLAANSSDLYNGNIGRMITTITDPNTREVLPLGNAYKYDQLNRLKQSKSFTNINLVTNSWGSGGTTRYYNAFSYDANGNIENQLRQNHTGAVIDSLTYHYHDVSGKRLQNRLYGVNDSESSGSFADDIDDMGVFDSDPDSLNAANNYVYDAEGRLVHDEQEEIETIEWRVDGKVKKIDRPTTSSKKDVSFDYDAMGHRIAKHVLSSAGLLEKSTYYILDAQGNVMSVYERTVDTEAESVAFAQTEKHIYGSSRLGMHDQPVAMLGSQNDTYVMDTVNHRIGHRLYELSNHLGNVLSVVSDKLMPSAEEYETVVDFDDRFDTDGDFLGWDGYHWATDTTFVDNGAQAFVGYGYALKYWPLITDVIPYYNGNWVTNYTFTCDIVYMNPGGSVTIGTDGSAYQTFYSSGPQTWNFSYNPYFGAGMEITANGDSIVLDNIKLIHDVPPYQYRVADIRQSTDYSPFGVTLENRNLTLTGAEKSRYSFQGQEKVDEVSGDGNSYTAEFWQYDSRLGRRWNIDPVIKHQESPYACFANNPIWVIDPTGADSSLFDQTKGFLVAEGITKEDDKTAIWIVDTQSKDYDKNNPWKTAKKLVYTIGKSQKEGIGKDNLREFHPLAGKGWNYGDQVYEEDLIDMTTEFNELVAQYTPYFAEKGKKFDENIARIRDCWVCSWESYQKELESKEWGFIVDVGPNRPFDLKSRSRNNLALIPSYAAIVIGQYSFCNGRLMNYDDYGNAAYGAWGRAYGYKIDHLTNAANFDQFMHSGSDDPGRDQYFVKYGYWRLNF